MGGMGKRSLTNKAWKAQRCFASEVKFLGRKVKRTAKGLNASALRQQARREVAAQTAPVAD